MVLLLYVCTWTGFFDLATDGDDTSDLVLSRSRLIHVVGVGWSSLIIG